MSKYRYFIKLSYKGTSYCGWQIQPNGITVQGELERALSILLKSPVKLTGAGRTDAGVHASYFIAHFDTEYENLHQDISIIYKINRLVSKDIAIHSLIPVHSGAHARFDAISRTYHYRIATEKNPFTTDLAYHFYKPLDLDAMNEAALIMLEYDDFTSFSKLHGNAKTNMCNIREARWLGEYRSKEICFIITANRFLRNMVRAITGTLIKIGTGKESPDIMHKVIESRNRNAAGPSVPPQGLYLAHIAYPEEIRIDQ